VTQESEFEDPNLVNTNDDVTAMLNAYFPVVYFFKTNVGSSGSNAHSKCRVTAIAIRTQRMLTWFMTNALMVKNMSARDMSSHTMQQCNSHNKLVRGPY
jgi:hypothetical protein